MKKTSIFTLCMPVSAMGACKHETPGSCLLFEGGFTSDKETQILTMHYDARGRIIQVKSDGLDYANYVYSENKIVLTEKMEERGITRDYITSYALDNQGRVSATITSSSISTYTDNTEGYLTKSERTASNGDYKRTNLTCNEGNLTKLEMRTDAQLSERYTYTCGSEPVSANFMAFGSIAGLEDYAGLLKNNFGKGSKNQVIKSVFQLLPSTKLSVSAHINYTYSNDGRGNVIGLSGESDNYSFQITYKYNCR